MTSLWDRVRKNTTAKRRRQSLARRQREYLMRHPPSVTVTLADRQTGALVTRVAENPAGRAAALRDAVYGHPPEAWRVLAVSTTDTILKDIRGRRLAAPLPETSLLPPAGLGAYLAD